MKKALCILFVFALFCIPISAASSPAAQQDSYSCLSVTDEDFESLADLVDQDFGWQSPFRFLKVYRTNLNFHKNYQKGASIEALLDSYAETVFIVSDLDGTDEYYQMKDGNVGRLDFSSPENYNFARFRNVYSQFEKVFEYAFECEFDGYFDSYDSSNRNQFYAYLNGKPMHIRNLTLIFTNYVWSFTPTFIIESEEGRFFGISKSFADVSEIRWMSEDTFLSYADALTKSIPDEWYHYHYTNEPVQGPTTITGISPDAMCRGRKDVIDYVGQYRDRANVLGNFSYVNLQTVAEWKAEVKRTVVIVTVCVLAAVAAGAVAFCILKNRKRKQTLAAEAENPAENLAESPVENLPENPPKNPAENPAENLPENLPENPPENPAESCPPKE